jgi:amidase
VDLDKARDQRNLTGPFIQQFLTPEDISIISKDSVDIVNEIRGRKLSAVQVTIAFCKTAAIAHQIASFPSAQTHR